MSLPSLFEDVEWCRSLRVDLAPLLRTWPSVRVWHAGLSSGQEVYETAILLREEGLWPRIRLWATDAEAPRVHRAQAGRFPASVAQRAAELYRESGGRAALEEYAALEDGELVLRSGLREKITFFEHDAGEDASFAEFQLVVYRPDRYAVSRRALGIVQDSVCRFGLVAVMGRVGLEHGPSVTRYERLNLSARAVYRRIA